MSTMNDSKSWKIGGGVIIGIALGLMLKDLSTMALPGFTILGLGFGLFTSSNIKGEVYE